ncbi:MAG: hypothetical protein EOM17_15480, partial [Synergistales bacterium]|nr:hypothetical protein [Synergistales bacterium]
MKKSTVYHLGIFLIFLMGGCAFFPKPNPSLNIEKLSPGDIAKVQALVAKLEPFIQAKKEKGELPALTFKELASPLVPDEKRFLKAFRELPAGPVGVRIPFRGFSQGCKNLVRLEGQKIRVRGLEKEIPPQFLSPHIYAAYQFMMQAMQRDIGKRLLVESAYRSSAYQLYLFVYYLSNHDYSIRETAKWVALPGYS